jgi:hypothetical protein
VEIVYRNPDPPVTRRIVSLVQVGSSLTVWLQVPGEECSEAEEFTVLKGGRRDYDQPQAS